MKMETVRELPSYEEGLEDSDNEGIVLTRRYNSPSSADYKSRGSLAKEASGDVFCMVYKIAAVEGLPVSSSWISSMSSASGLLLKAWIALFTVVKTVWFAVVFGYNGLLWSSAGLRMCYFLHCVTGYFLTLNFITKRHKTAACINRIRYLSAQLHSDSASKKSRTKLLLLASVLILSAFLGCTFDLFFNVAYDDFYNNLLERIPLEPGSEYHSVLCHFLLASVVLCYNMSTVTLYVALLLCTNAYNTAGDMFAFYAKRFKEDVVRDIFTTQTASEYTDVYRRIIASIDQMDKALNTCSFYIYMAVINCVFHVISVILSKDALFLNPTAKMFTALITLSACFMFFQLTYSGENLPSKSNRLKDEMIQMSNFVVSQRPNSANIMMFKILSENIKDNKPYATGFGLFNITKKFIPSVIGVILTYGVLLEQIGAT